jgi:polysaccharide export outer membrane protein
MHKARILCLMAIAVVCGSLAASAAAQTPRQRPQGQTTRSVPTEAKPPQSAQPPQGVQPPPGYVIGPDDVLTIKFFSDAQLSTDATVRADGMISVPLLNDVHAAGLTPEQLGDALEKAASKFVTEPDATVIVREIRSRKVYVIGQGVAHAGVVTINADMNVLQVLATAGGLVEYADKENILILRNEGGREQRFKFNFDEVVKGKNVKQNILLRPGDTVVVN